LSLRRAAAAATAAASAISAAAELMLVYALRYAFTPLDIAAKMMICDFRHIFIAPPLLPSC